MKYRVTGQMTISVFVDVEAKNAREARQRAKEASVMALCFRCTEGHEGLWSTGELDGEPVVNRTNAITVLQDDDV